MLLYVQTQQDPRINTAIGCNALRYNTTGSNNTAIGQSALFYNTTGTDNTAIGRRAALYLIQQEMVIQQ
jgi:hypothetical protein